MSLIRERYPQAYLEKVMTDRDKYDREGGYFVVYSCPNPCSSPRAVLGIGKTRMLAIADAYNLMRLRND
jgi:hypothetical protein